jgi:hypothetical protein
LASGLLDSSFIPPDTLALLGTATNSGEPFSGSSELRDKKLDIVRE